MFGFHDSHYLPIRRGILDALSITKVRFTPGFMPHEERNFLRQLLTFMGEKTQPKVSEVGKSYRLVPPDQRAPCV